MPDLTLSSPVFENGGEIPRKHGYKTENISPPLKIEGVSEDAKSLALIVDDPDAMGAVGKIWVHWLLWNIHPKTSKIEEGTIPENSTEGRTDFEEIGYGGPAPPDKRHTYVFKLYALNSTLNLSRGATKNELESAMKDHIISEAKLEGTFAP